MIGTQHKSHTILKKDKMNKKIVGIFFFILLFSITILPVSFAWVGNTKTRINNPLKFTDSILEDDWPPIVKVQGCFNNTQKDVAIEREILIQIGIGLHNLYGIYRNITIVGKTYMLALFNLIPLRILLFEEFIDEFIKLKIDFFIGIFNDPSVDYVCLNGWAKGIEPIYG